MNHANTSVDTPRTSQGEAIQSQHPAGQFALMGQRRFAPFFWTQFLGAANDNLFKFAFTVMVTYQLQVAWLPADLAGLVIGALFILPFLLFSATSGQLADKLDRRLMINGLKWAEIAIMVVAAWGFWAQSIPLLLACVFLMGLQSAVFGPVKFAYMPQHLSERELTGGKPAPQGEGGLPFRFALRHFGDAHGIHVTFPQQLPDVLGRVAFDQASRFLAGLVQRDEFVCTHGRLEPSPRA